MSPSISESTTRDSPSLSRSASASSVPSSALTRNLPPTSNPVSKNPILPTLHLPQQITSAPAPLLLQQADRGSGTPTLDSPISWEAADPVIPFDTFSPVLNKFVSVNELAHRIFDGEDYASVSYQNATSQPVSDPAGPALIDGVMISASTVSLHNEARVTALATEIGASSTVMSHCITQYFRHLYPIMPIIHESTFRRKLNRLEELSSEDKCLLLSMCAVTILHASPPSGLTLDAKKSLGRQFLSYFLNMRRLSEWIETASLDTIIASYFASVSYFELKQPRSSNFYVREATGMALEQGLHLDSFYIGMDQVAEICHRRAFALLFVTERGASILRNKPISISRLPALPMDFFSDEDPCILTGFQCLCRLFSLLDEKFIEVWRSSESQTPGPSIEQIAAIQRNLSTMSFDSANLPEIQRADVQITQQWLRLIFWQASMRQGIISSKSENPAFTYSYPILIGQALCKQISSISINAVAVHGLGIFEKVFEVAYTLMDALTIAKIPWPESEELKYLFSCLSANPNSHSTYVRMLETKLDGQKMRLHSLSKGGKLLQSPELAEQQHVWQDRLSQGSQGARTPDDHTSDSTPM